jgi:hypothetical protein
MTGEQSRAGLRRGMSMPIGATAERCTAFGTIMTKRPPIELQTAPPQHSHTHKTTARTALLLILGSSPMVEGIPAFFVAGK